METSHVQQDRYDNDNNDMHERLLDPRSYKYLPLWQHKKETEGEV